MPMYRHMKPNIHHPYSITHISIGSWLGSYVVFMVTAQCPCTVIWNQTSIIHTPSHILVLGLGLGHMLFLWWLTMYRHMKANIHHPYSIRHIGIGFWIGSYVVFMVTVHVPPYETKHPYSILHHAYRYWVMACVICCFYGDGPCTMTDHVPSYESKHSSSILHQAYWYWVLDRVICCFYGDCPCTAIWNQTSILHTPSRI